MSNEVALAEHELRNAQERLAVARKREADLATFSVTGKVFAVMAKVPTHGQWVSYSNTGILVAVFTDEHEAVRYTKTIKAPVGTDFVIEPMALHG